MLLPASIQVCPVEIPGRGRKEGEQSINSVADLAQTLAHSLPLKVCNISNPSYITSCVSESILSS